MNAVRLDTKKNYFSVNIQFFDAVKIQIKTLALIATEGKHNLATVKQLVEDTPPI